MHISVFEEEICSSSVKQFFFHAKDDASMMTKDNKISLQVMF